MMTFLQNDEHKRKCPSFTCPKGHTYLLDKYQIQVNGIVLPMVLCPVDGCGFHEFIKLDGWVENAQAS